MPARFALSMQYYNRPSITGALRRSGNDAVEGGLAECNSSGTLHFFLPGLLLREELHLSSLVATSNDFAGFYQNLKCRKRKFIK